MPQLLLRGRPLGAVEALLFDKDGTLSISEPRLLTLAAARVFLCLERVPADLRPLLQDLLERAYGLRPGGRLCPAGTMAVAARDHNLISTATVLVQVGLGWPEALALSVEVLDRADAQVLHGQGGHGSGDQDGAVISATTPGLLQFLERCRAAGVVCAVISNDDTAGIGHFLASHGLERYFSGCWSADDRPRKPDPAAVHGLCANLALPVTQCGLIGDSNSDLAMAVAAGIPHQRSLGYTAAWSLPPPLAEPHPLVHHWDELAFC